ncbi:MAG: hypothetical protein WBV85_01985 [Solirubrobacteraceae bacterium]
MLSYTGATERASLGAARITVWFLSLLTCGALLLATGTTTATAALTHPFLSSFGAFASVESIATDSAGNVYVYDGGAGAIYKFDAAGSPVDFSATGTNAISNVGFAFDSEGEIAVDNSPGPAKGDIYIARGVYNGVPVYNVAGQQVGELTERSGEPWGEPCGVAVDPSGNVYVGLYPENVDKYTPTANPVTNSDYASSLSGTKEICSVATDAAGDVFTDGLPKGPVTRYEPSQFGSPSATGSVVDIGGSALTVSANDDKVYIDEGNQVVEFGPRGVPFEKPLDIFGASGAGALRGSEGVAVSPVNDDVYVADGKGSVDIFGPGVLLPTVSTGPASNLAVEAATVSGEANPEGAQTEQCFFEYGETTAYGHTAPCAETPGEIGAGNQNVEVHADLTGLTQNATYHYRLVVSTSNGSSQGADAEFGLAAPAIGEEYASDATDSSVTLHGSLDPESNKAEYYFEYGPTTSYGKSSPGREVPAGISFLPAEAHLQELTNGTAYHYRLVARSLAGATYGSDLIFTTQGAGGPLALLDGRQWELVSPPMKYGAGILPQYREGSIIQASEAGDAITYIAENPIETEPEGNRALEPAQIMARRAAGGGWTNRTMTPPSQEIHGLPLGLGSGYRMFSSDLSQAIIEPAPVAPLAPTASERTAYLRDEAACDAKATSCFTPFVTPGDTMPGAKWDTLPEGVQSNAPFIDASADLKHSVLHSSVQLLEGAPQEGLYEWSEGHLQLVSVNEAGEAVDGELGGASQSNVRNAISSDGSKIIWCEHHPSTGCVFGGLYMRDTARNETIRLDPREDERREFQIATEDDSRVFFTIHPSRTPEERLEECEVPPTGRLTCNATEVAPDVVGLVIGINGDGTTAYFVSTASLSTGAQAGEDNLYVSHMEGGKWNARLIAKLSGEDAHDWGNSYKLLDMTARVSPNGNYLAFMSERSLTGYDNRDAVSGEPDEEVFVYNDETGKLVCASCNRSGVRPHGLDYYPSSGARPLVNSAVTWINGWVAGSVPGWDNLTISQALRQPRYLSDEGRLFFDSSDGLVPQDSNGLEDVYEYEPEGVGSCAQAEGCVGLISSGAAGEESVFFDASASGDDAFFITNAQLTSQDIDSAVDVYDAHVCTETVPCTSWPVSPPPCNSGDSCKPAPTPQPSIFGAPASATFSGTGNLAQPSAVAHKAVKPLKKKRHKTKHKSKRVKRKAKKAHRSTRKSTQGHVTQHKRANKGRGR